MGWVRVGEIFGFSRFVLSRYGSLSETYGGHQAKQGVILPCVAHLHYQYYMPLVTNIPKNITSFIVLCINLSAIPISHRLLLHALRAASEHRAVSRVQRTSWVCEADLPVDSRLRVYAIKEFRFPTTRELPLMVIACRWDRKPSRHRRSLQWTM